MKKFSWNDGMRNRSRTPRLFLVKGESEVFEFLGSNIPTVCGVIGSQHRRNGKWSNTSYDLALADDVTVVELCRPFEGWGSPSFENLRKGFVVLTGEEIITNEFIIRIAKDFLNPEGFLKKFIDEAIETENIINSL